jgi:hypothetical protein
VPDEFHGDETLLTSYEISSFSLLDMSARLMIFIIMKHSIKPPIETDLMPTDQNNENS